MSPRKGGSEEKKPTVPGMPESGLGQDIVDWANKHKWAAMGTASGLVGLPLLLSYLTVDEYLNNERENKDTQYRVPQLV